MDPGFLERGYNVKRCKIGRGGSRISGKGL